jgi:peptide/nickel transport system substrate-binding protein
MQRISRRRAIRTTAAASASAAAAWLVACGGDSGDSGEAQTKAPTSATADPAAAQGTARGAPAGALTIAVDTLQDESLDIARFSAGQQLNQMLSVNDTLVRRDHEGKFAPALATKWRSDETGWEFELNPAAKFHDGTPVTAEDVAFMVERMLAPDSKNFLAGDIRSVLTSVEAPGPNTVRFNTKAPFPLMLTVAWGIAPQPKAYFTRVGVDAAVANYVGSGPFKLKRHSRGQSMTFEAVDGFYEPNRVPRLREVTFRIIPDAGTRLAALTTGEVDVALLGFNEAKRVREGDSIRVLQTRAAGGRHLVVHDLALDDRSMLKDVRVRRALLHGIDRAAIVKTVFGGFAEVMPTPFFPNLLGFDPNLKPHAFDVREAKQLLSAAGVPDGYEVTINSFGSGTAPDDDFPVIASYWQQLGLKATIRHQETLAYLDQLANRRLRGVGHMSYSSAVAGIDGVKLWNSYVACGAQYSNACVSEFDMVRDRAQRELNEAEREKLLKQMNQTLYDELLVLPRYFTAALVGVGPKVKKLEFPPGWVYLSGYPLENAEAQV